jgi:hypothetical protein
MTFVEPPFLSWFNSNIGGGDGETGKVFLAVLDRDRIDTAVVGRGLAGQAAHTSIEVWRALGIFCDSFMAKSPSVDHWATWYRLSTHLFIGDSGVGVQGRKQ